jgi:hypothetical protein
MNSRLNKSSENGSPEAAGGPPLESTTSEFPSGVVGWSRRAIELQNKIDFEFYLRRHLRGDDGDVSEGQHLRNFFAWRNGLRVSSVYNTPASPDGKICIVTEADRSRTYILLPSDYPACMMSPEAAMSTVAEESRQTWVFPPGRIGMSLRTAYLYNKIDFEFYLRRHLLGDDGDVSEDQRQRNRLAQRDGLRIWSIYNIPEDPEGKIWIITEADRSVTHIMLPSEHDAPDPYDMTKCDECGQHKQTVRSRRVITVGLKSGTLRWKFCDECVATLRKSLQANDEEDNNRQRL